MGQEKRIDDAGTISATISGRELSLLRPSPSTLSVVHCARTDDGDPVLIQCSSAHSDAPPRPGRPSSRPGDNRSIWEVCLAMAS